MKDEVEAEQEKELQYERKIEEEKKINEERKMGKEKKVDGCSTEVEMDELKKNTVVKRTRSHRINILTKGTAQPLLIPVPYPNAKPDGAVVTAMYCGICSKHPTIATKESEFSKKSGTNNFKNETPKKHEASKNHQKCVAAEKAINNPKSTEMYKCCKQLYDQEEEKVEKKFKTAFYISALERPLDDYESLCTLQKLNGVELGETYLTRSACTDFIDHISSVMKDDLADTLKACNFFSLMIDGSTDHGVIEEAIMYVRYLDKSVGRPLIVFLRIEEPKTGTGRGFLEVIDSCFQSVTNLNSDTWKEKTTGLGTDGCAAMTGEKNGVVGLLRKNKAFMGFWCGAHKLELAVVKCLEKFPEFVKVRDTLRSLYQEYHYSAKALRELKELAELFDDQISRPTNVFGARWLPHLQTALQVLFRGYRTLMMHCQNTKEMRKGSSGRQGRAAFSVKVQLTPKIIFPLTKSTSFPNYFSEKIISIDKIPTFLQAFKVVISSPTTEQNGIWVGLLVTSLKELGTKNSRDFDWASSAVKT